MEKCSQADCLLTPQTVAEIQYHMAYTCLKQLKEQGRVPLKKLRLANVAIAEKHRVLPYEI